MDEELTDELSGVPDQQPDQQETSERNDELSIESLVEQLTKERDEFKDMALRVQAEFENYRKRSAVQQIDEVDRNTGRLVEGLLAVLDACEAAVAHDLNGVEPILSSLLLTLNKQGLEVLELLDTVFYPSLA